MTETIAVGFLVLILGSFAIFYAIHNWVIDV